MKIGIAADHGGFELKQLLLSFFESNNFDIVDFGATTLNNEDDYPDLIIPLATALKDKKIERGIAICGSGVGACIAANKIKGVRACLINDHFSAHQGVEDDDMNLICLGGRVTGLSVAKEFIEVFLSATFTKVERHVRRLNKVISLENGNK
jgi:ribose 5-phosphate isomerase B